MGIGLSREQINEKIINELNHVQKIASNNNLKPKERKKLIQELIHSHHQDELFSSSPFFYINLDGSDKMVLIHLVLNDGTHICYIYRPCEKSYARIIYPAAPSSNGEYLFGEILTNIKEASGQLYEKLKGLNMTEAMDMAKKTPASLETYATSGAAKPSDVNSLLNKVNGYLGFGNFLFSMPDIPLNQEVVDAFTQRILNGLKP